MSDEGPTTVGSIVGRLILDDSSWNETLDRAKVKARELTSSSPTVRVETEGADRAVVQLDRVTAAEGRAAAESDVLTNKTRTGGKAAGDAGGRFGMLAATIATIAPATVPVAAAAVGLTASLGGMGAAGVLAVLGIKKAMADGTAQGAAYKTVFDSLLADAGRLEQTASNGLLPGVQSAAATLERAMPNLNREVGMFTGQLAGMLPSGVDAVVTAFTRLEPLLQASGSYLGHVVSGLDGFTHSQAFGDFVTYAVQELPQVETLIDSVIRTVGDFIAAWAPIGAVTLPLLTGLVSLVDQIVSHTGPLVPILIGVAGGFKLWTGVTAIADTVVAAVGAITAAFDGMTISEALASDGLSLLAGGAAAAGAVALLASYGQGDGSTSGSKASGKPNEASIYQSASAGPDTSYNGFGAGAASAASGMSTAQRVADSWQRVQAALNASLDQTIEKEKALGDTAQDNESKTDAYLDSIDTLTAGVKENGKTLVQNTTAGRANRENLNDSVEKLKAVALGQATSTDANGKATVNQQKYNAALQAGIPKLLQQAEKIGLNKTEVEKLIATFSGLKSKTVDATVRTAAAKSELKTLQEHISGLQGKTVTVKVLQDIEVTNSAIKAAQMASGLDYFGNRSGHAYGGTIGAANGATAGTVTGPGTSVDDLAGMFRLSNKEEVISDIKGQASFWRSTLKAINAGAPPARVLSVAAVNAGIHGSSQPQQVTHRTVAPEIHVHNPVAVDPIQQTAEAAQLALAYAGLG